MTRTTIALSILCLLCSISLFAQTSNATLGGTVTDASGAYMPGVTITAVNTGTGIVNTTITNEAGAYNFPSLQTGTYTLSAELLGFQPRKYTNVTLGVSQQVRQNINTRPAGFTARTSRLKSAAWRKAWT
jgi:hypothetical protein